MKKALPPEILIVYSLFIPPIMIFLFAISNILPRNMIGYFFSYMIYVILLLCGIIIFKKKQDDISCPVNNYKCAYYILAFFPVILMFFTAFLPTVKYVKLSFLLLLLIYSLLNGTVEELFWRNTFNKVFGDNIIRAYIIPTVLFSCWHFSLLFANEFLYHGRAFAIVIGAIIMGFIWGLVMFKTKNITVVILSHILINFFVFTQLLYENGFIK